MAIFDFIRVLFCYTDISLEHDAYLKKKAEGEEIGIEKGRKIEVAENARKLKALGVAIDIIAQGTGLTYEEVENI